MTETAPKKGLYPNTPDQPRLRIGRTNYLLVWDHFNRPDKPTISTFQLVPVKAISDDGERISAWQRDWSDKSGLRVDSVEEMELAAIALMAEIKKHKAVVKRETEKITGPQKTITETV